MPPPRKDTASASDAGFRASWTALEPPPPPSRRSGLTSSDDAPRYRRGSKRRPKPPKTNPGLVGPTHRALAVARFEGKGRGYAAIEQIPACTMLFQERPLQVVGDFASAHEARRAMARVIAGDPRYAHLSAADAAQAAQRPKREPSPIADRGVDDDQWNLALARVAANAFVRAAKRGDVSTVPADANGTAPGTASATGSDGRPGPGKETATPTGYVARLFAHVSVCNHSCRPNAAVSVSDEVVTLYSLRAIRPGEEITVSYGTSLLWLPLQMRRTQLARVWGFLCKCDRCREDLERAVAERERAGHARAQASRHGVRSDGWPEEESGFTCWEYGDTGYEAQFDEEGKLRSAVSGGEDADGEKGGRRAGQKTATAAAAAADTSTSDSSDDSSSSLSDSSDDSSDEGGGGFKHGSLGSRKSGWGRGGGGKGNAAGKQKLLGPGRLYNKLVKAGIGPDHWQMHATREILVSRLLSEEGRKDFDLDLLLEHANCAARLAPNHPHFIRLVTLVEEVFKSNREVVAAEQFWLWTIELLREAMHPDVLFWNTEFKGISEREDGGFGSAKGF